MRDSVVILLSDRGRYLFVRRGEGGSDPGLWGPVSGKVEPGETQAEAVVREAREEVGIEVRPVERAAETISSCGRFRLHWWRAELAGGVAAPASPEVVETRWVEPAGIESLEPAFAKDLEVFRELLG